MHELALGIASKLKEGQGWLRMVGWFYTTLLFTMIVILATRAIEDAIIRYDPFHRIEVNSRTWENMGEHGIQARPCEHFWWVTSCYILLHISNCHGRCWFHFIRSLGYIHDHDLCTCIDVHHGLHKSSYNI